MSALDFRLLMKQERAKAKAARLPLKHNTTLSPATALSHEHFAKKRLSDYKVHNTKLNDIYYVPNFFTKEEEKALLVNAYTQPQWSTLAHRRLQHFGGVPHASGMIPETLPSWCHSILDRLVQFGCFPNEEREPNHILLNEYTPPGGKISPHNDGGLYYESVSIVSLRSPAVFDFYAMPSESSNGGSGSSGNSGSRVIQQLLVMPRSLLVFRGEAYTHYLHGIQPRDQLEVTRKNFEACDSTVYVSQNDVCASSSFSALPAIVETSTNDETKKEKIEAKTEAKTEAKAKEIPDLEKNTEDLTFDQILRQEGSRISVSCKQNKRISFTVRSVLSVVDHEPIENQASRDERDRRKRVFLNGASDDAT